MLNVKKVNYNQDYTKGCKTCDWGSSYVNEIEIILEDGTYSNIKVDKMYNYALSESDCMKLIANSDTIDDFILNIIKLIEKEAYEGRIGLVISLQDLWIAKNGKDVDILKSLEEKKIITREG